jgi:hypothetical protein
MHSVIRSIGVAALAVAAPPLAAQSARDACADAARALVRQQTSWEDSDRRSFGDPSVLSWRAYDGTRGSCRVDARGRVDEVRVVQWGGGDDVIVWPPGGGGGVLSEERGFNRKGGDYASFRASTLGDCQAACERDGRCRAYAYDLRESYCWLKAQVPPAQPSRDMVSGARGAGSGAGGSLSEQWGYDRRGGDYRDFRAGSLGVCQRACEEERRCRAYSFDTRTGACYLKDQVAPSAPREEMVTGHKR